MINLSIYYKKTMAEYHVLRNMMKYSHTCQNVKPEPNMRKQS